MNRTRIEPSFVAALLVGASYYANVWLDIQGTPAVVWKGAGVALLALWARGKAVNSDGRMVGAVLALGALGDVLLELQGMAAGAVAFLAGHFLASYLYLRNRRVPAAHWIAPAVAAGMALLGWWMFKGDAQVGMLAFYLFGLSLMTASAMLSRLGTLVALGALLFFVSDWLIFLNEGRMIAPLIAKLLVWPTYFIGQALIAWGAVHMLRGDKAAA
ncbi:lysoplasmalogenase family protein [Sphingomonas sp. HITSZ_GF]|uniref:lysoplasmalogenase family protein n=1 Tax=Sphingomonas sp. HITSZ_GF TaxID=3037247 RepID=UPI00240E4771|nr:lysoplasmalogenase family protein [Sphingomonas sp. HITSZ_GF]MDG2532831.1 lysoplasmalogenase family protein [Sphingomonas sp. HITSZ_GF]